jgi:Putative prokaryotic signal transducing protein
VSADRTDRQRSSISKKEHRMKAIKTYSTRVEADVARIALDAAGIRSVVVGVGTGMEGGTGGVQLLVEEDHVKRALKVLGDG